MHLPSLHALTTHKNYVMKLSAKLLLLSALLFLSACSSTALPRTSISKDIFELAAGNQAPILLEVSLEEGSASDQATGLVGHQYLFVAIPFGSVYLPSASETISNSMYQRLVLQGLKPITSKSHVFGALPRLHLKVTSLSLSAYDFIFTRKVAASLEGRATLFAASGEPLWEMPFSARESELRRYGFAAELEQALSKALEEALTQVALGTATSLAVMSHGIPNGSVRLR
jgi:hypothetical protein